MADDQMTFVIAAKDNASTTVKGIRGLLNDTAKEAKTSLLTGVGLAGGVAAFNLLSNAVGGAVSFVGDAISAASDMNETVSKLRTVFGASATDIEKWGSTSATTMGMSEQAALEAAGTFGNLFTAMKINVPAAAEMSKGIIELSADLASFNNSNPEEVLIALRAGLVGETEPLRKFGVNLSAVTIAAKAVELGLAASTSQVSAGAKAQAAYALIMEQTTTAQGDFARTSSGLANTSRSLGAAMHDITTEIGQALLPVMTALANFALDSLIPALRLVIEASEAFIELWVSPSAKEALERLEARFPKALEEVSGNADAAASHYMAMGVEIQGASKKVAVSSAAMAKSINTEWDQAHAAAVAAAIALPGDISKALIDGVAAVEAGVTALTDLMTDEWTDATRIAYLKGVLASDELARGLASRDADVRGAARTLQANAATELNALRSGAYDAAVNAGTTVATQLRLQSANAGAAAGHLAQVAMNHLKIDGTHGGRSAGSSWINAMIGAVQHGRLTLQQEMNEIRNLMGHSLPTKGPLAGMATRLGGLAIGRSWMTGIGDGIRGQIGNLTAAMPGLGGGAIRGPAALGAGGGGNGLTVIFQTAFPPSPSQANGIAQSIGPELERWRRQQGLA